MFAAAKGGNNPCPSTEAQNVACPPSGVWLSLKREGNSGARFRVDTPVGHDAPWNRPVTEGHLQLKSHAVRDPEPPHPPGQNVDNRHKWL